MQGSRQVRPCLAKWSKRVFASTVLVVDIADRTGLVGELARGLAVAGVNIELLYTTFGGVKIVIATYDIDSATAALE